MDTQPRPTDYLRVSVTLFDNPKLAAIADEHGPATYVMWLYLLTLTKRAKHLGRFTAPPVRIARMVGIDSTVAVSIMKELVRLRCIIPLEGEPHHFMIRNWAKWQSMSAGERSRKYRESKTLYCATDTVTDATPIASQNVVHGTHHKDAHPQTDVTGSVTSEQRERDERTTLNKDEDKDKELGTNVPLSAETSDEHESTDPDQADIDAVFAHWKTHAAPIQLDDPKRARLTPERRKKIATRLTDGYSVEELTACIDGFIADKHHSGKNAAKTPYLDLTTIFRTGSKVDAGIRIARAALKRMPVGGSLVRPQ